MNPPRDHPSSRGRRSQSQRVSEAVDDVPRRWRPRAPRTGGPGARRSAEKRLRRKRFGYAEAQICTHSRTQATVTRRNRGRSTKSRRRLTPQRGAHAARTLTPFCPLGPKVKFCFHSATNGKIFQLRTGPKVRTRRGRRPRGAGGPEKGEGSEEGSEGSLRRVSKGPRLVHRPRSSMFCWPGRWTT